MSKKRTRLIIPQNESQFTDWMNDRFNKFEREGWPATLPISERPENLQTNMRVEAEKHIARHGVTDPYLRERIATHFANGVAGPLNYTPTSEA